MNKYQAFGLALLMGAGAANAATLSASGPTGVATPAPRAACTLGEDDITQNADCGVQDLFGIACNDGFQTNGSYYRRFFLTTDHGITEEYTVDAVQLAAEIDAPGFDGTNVITVNIYALPIGAELTIANLGAPIDSGSFDLGGNFNGEQFTVPLSGTAAVDPATDDLVVEYLGPNHLGEGTGGQFFPGANPEGQTQRVFIASEDCGIIDPAPLDELGFPDSHNVMVVEGTEGGGGDDPTFTENFCITFDNFCDSISVLNGIGQWDFTCDGVTLAPGAQVALTRNAQAFICGSDPCPSGEDWSFVFRGGPIGTFNLFNLTQGIQFQADSPYTVLPMQQCEFIGRSRKPRMIQ
ncbi:MAG: hypothetical protein AAFX85_03610 [Pseudomonadota bacterium]